MIFRTPYQIDPFQDCKKSSPCGSRFAPKYQVNIDMNGNRELVRTGETDLYEVIQSFRDDSDFKLLLERCRLTGDMSPLQQVQGVYVDARGLPKDLRDIHDIDNAARNIYERSDILKEHFGSYSEMLAGMSTDSGLKDFFDKYGKGSEAAASVVGDGDES